MKMTLELNASEAKALRRAVATLYAEELARNPFRKRKSRLAEMCEVLMDKFDSQAGKEPQR
jgi:hypothetical protein